MPATAPPSIGEVLEYCKPLLEAGRDVVSIHLSAGIAGTYHSAPQARAQFAERGHDGRIEALESRTMCAGPGLMLFAAATRTRTGGSLGEVAHHALEARDGVRNCPCLDTLEYLQRGGRAGGAQACGCLPLCVSEVPPAIGVNAGPGMVGVGAMAR